MPKAKQLTVACENRPGTLAHIAKVLGDARLNILSCLATTSGTEGSVQVVVDSVIKAKKALDGAGLSHTEADVLQVELPNTPGALGKFAGKLAEKGVNITSGCQTAVKGSSRLHFKCLDGQPQGYIFKWLDTGGGNEDGLDRSAFTLRARCTLTAWEVLYAYICDPQSHFPGGV